MADNVQFTINNVQLVFCGTIWVGVWGYLCYFCYLRGHEW